MREEENRKEREKRKEGKDRRSIFKECVKEKES